MTKKPTEKPGTRGSVVEFLGKLAVGRFAWLIGAPMLVFGAGLLLLWWSMFELRNQVADLQQRASERVEARLVDRYYRLRPTEPDAQPRHSDCKDLCTISMNSVAVFAFDLSDGTSQRVQFEQWAHDWQHNTDFELGLPLLHADFVAPPAFLARLRSTRASYDPNLSVWDLFWEPVDDAAHWLLRLRDPLPEFRAPLRYDPTEPSTAILDLPRFAAIQRGSQDHLDAMAIGLLGFVGIFAVLIMFPAVQLLLLGASRRTSIAVTTAICASVPLWAPHAGQIAPWMSDFAGQLAQELKREFSHHSTLPSYVSRPVENTQSLARVRWALSTSPQQAFLAGLDTSLPPGFDPLDHAGAYDALQASFDRQLQSMSSDAAAAVLKQLRHYQADTVWELFVPALLRIAGNPEAPAEQREDANDLLGFYADQRTLPDVDVFLYRHRLKNYQRLRQAPIEATRTKVAARLAEAEARVTRQLATY